MSKTSKTARQDADRLLIAGITKDLSNVTSVPSGGKTYSPAQLIALLQAEIAATDNVGQTHAAWLASVVAQKAATDGLTTIKSELHSFVVATFGPTSPVLADFGYVTKQRKTPTAAVKAEAVLKRAKTRQEDGTTGKLERQKLSGETPAAAAVPAIKPATNT
jgi:hypothetical protein